MTISPEPTDSQSDPTPDRLAVGDHRVTLTFTRGYSWPSIIFRCHAPESSPCRTICNESACEEGCVDPANHVREPVDYCNIEEWLNNTDDVEGSIFGRDTSVTRAIEVDWLGDGVEWRFA